jgi:hypothetical protein
MPRCAGQHALRLPCAYLHHAVQCALHAVRVSKREQHPTPASLFALLGQPLPSMQVPWKEGHREGCATLQLVFLIACLSDQRLDMDAATGMHRHPGTAGEQAPWPALQPAVRLS